MSRIGDILRSRWLWLPGVIAGAALLIFVVARSRAPQPDAGAETVHVLRVIRAPQTTVVPQVVGHGTAAPAQVWRAVAEVEGRVKEVHPELKSGAFLEAGQWVLTIDPREYELAVARLESEIAETKAALSELDIQEKNDRASLKIETDSLNLAEADLERVQNLIEKDQAVATEVREKERVYLAQLQRVQEIQNALNLIPQRRATLEATLAVRQAGLEQARLDLAKTRIEAPIACRVRDVKIEPGQFLAAGEVLFEADGTDATEVEAQFPIDQARRLIPREGHEEIGMVPDMERLRELFKLEATVRLTSGAFVAEWDARFDRIRERMDPITRTVAVVVVVDHPYEKAIPGKRPPLLRGAYCEVELRGEPLSDQVIVPRSALEGETVYVVGDDDRLAARTVAVRFMQEDFVCIDEGIEPGERVVVVAPMPAIVGTLIEPVEDEALAARWIRQARGGNDTP